ncbi:CDP-alcohol phosphatidyltransferase family protein [Naasia sp. SYSU D00948]|uniref:CDP-alcohol phosphatidyltransferase family protein n=1 Tax=Naasia sp. SYSU D00948 TaxID=2817379 RepID=UPI001FF03DB8|nr:CDP-alcohol phosphatidyltransferase family protein [Naasia sp. SYSU D00948]
MGDDVAAATMRSPSASPGRYSFRTALRRLAEAQKPAARGAPAYSVYVNRRLGRVLAAVSYVARLSPNGVTAISALFTFSAIAAVALLPPSLPLAIAVVLGLVLGYAFDSADGQLARLTGTGGPAGEWLDHVVDCAKTSSLHLAVLISMYRFFDLPSTALLLIPLLYAIVAALNFFAVILNDQLKAVYSGSRHSVYSSGGGTLKRSLLVLPTDYGFLCLAFLLLAVPSVFLVVYSLFFLANLLHTALALPKWFRDMKAIAPRAAGAPAASGTTPGMGEQPS